MPAYLLKGLYKRLLPALILLSSPSTSVPLLSAVCNVREGERGTGKRQVPVVNCVYVC